jgi:hypothetical protein
MRVVERYLVEVRVVVMVSWVVVVARAMYGTVVVEKIVAVRVTVVMGRVVRWVTVTVAAVSVTVVVERVLEVVYEVCEASKEEQAEERIQVKYGNGGGKVEIARRTLAWEVVVYIVVVGMVVVV